MFPEKYFPNEIFRFFQLQYQQNCKTYVLCELFSKTGVVKTILQQIMFDCFDLFQEIGVLQFPMF